LIPSGPLVIGDMSPSHMLNEFILDDILIRFVLQATFIPLIYALEYDPPKFELKHRAVMICLPVYDPTICSVEYVT
jgi:hypothetical protein